MGGMIRLFSGSTDDDANVKGRLLHSKPLKWILIVGCYFILIYFFGIFVAIVTIFGVVVPAIVVLDKMGSKRSPPRAE